MELVVKMNATESIKALRSNTLLKLISVLESDEITVSKAKSLKEEEKVVTKAEEQKEFKVDDTPVVTTSAKVYTIDELGRAGSEVVSKMGMETVSNILKEFGVVSLTALSEDKYGEFALKLRELGAKI